MAHKELLGKQFGLLTVIDSRGRDKWRNWQWKVRCQCGKEWIIRGFGLTGKNGAKGCSSCVKKTHDMTNHPVYRVWISMKARCQLPTHQAWVNYGGRGITVCKRWDESFENFWADMGATYQPGLTIDRIDNDRHYEPKNCRWATWKQQACNRQNSLGVDIAAISQQTGIPKHILCRRYYNNLPLFVDGKNNLKGDRNNGNVRKNTPKTDAAESTPEGTY